MTDVNRSGCKLKLRLERVHRAVDDEVPGVEAEMLASAARVLEEAEANGVELQFSNGQLSSSVLRDKYRELASRVWDREELPGESPTEPLHREHNGWGPPLDSEPDQPANQRELPWPILAMDVIDFLCTMMGPEDTLMWEEDAS